MNVVETYGLTKRYGSLHAVDQCNLQIEKGDIYGFIGRNGAGKSTVMKMI
ncbi:MAG: ATP-binding cassette domain-containing protein, partial [Raoultibacter sp.]